MNCYLKPLLMFMLISFLSASCMQAQEQSAKELDSAPDFRLLDLNQNTVLLSTYKDKQPVFLFFWTTWCPFCRKELKLLNQMHAELVKDGLEVLAINVGERPYKVANFVSSYQLTYKVLLDQDTNVASAYEVLGVPTYVLVNKKGVIRLTSHSFPKEKYKNLILE